MTEIPLQALAGGSTPRATSDEVAQALANGSTRGDGNVIPYVAGYYQTKLVKGGVFVGVRLWRGFGKQDGRELDEVGAPNPVIARGWQWRAMLDGVEVHPWKVWPYCSGDPITEEEYRYLLARRDHAIRYDTSSPFASPRQRVDWLTVKHDFSDMKGPQS